MQTCSDCTLPVPCQDSSATSCHWTFRLPHPPCQWGPRATLHPTGHGTSHSTATGHTGGLAGPPSAPHLSQGRQSCPASRSRSSCLHLHAPVCPSRGGALTLSGQSWQSEVLASQWDCPAHVRPRLRGEVCRRACSVAAVRNTTLGVLTKAWGICERRGDPETPPARCVTARPVLSADRRSVCAVLCSTARQGPGGAWAGGFVLMSQQGVGTPARHPSGAAHALWGQSVRVTHSFPPWRF